MKNVNHKNLLMRIRKYPKAIKALRYSIDNNPSLTDTLTHTLVSLDILLETYDPSESYVPTEELLVAAIFRDFGGLTGNLNLSLGALEYFYSGDPLLYGAAEELIKATEFPYGDSWETLEYPAKVLGETLSLVYLYDEYAGPEALKDPGKVRGLFSDVTGWTEGSKKFLESGRDELMEYLLELQI